MPYGVAHSPHASESCLYDVDEAVDEDFQMQQEFVQMGCEHEMEHEYEDEGPTNAALNRRDRPGSSTDDFQLPWQNTVEQYRANLEDSSVQLHDNSKRRKTARLRFQEDSESIDRVERVPNSSFGMGSGSGDVEDYGNSTASAVRPSTHVDAACMPGYNPSHMGHAVTAKVPEFRHGTADNSTWMSYADAYEDAIGMKPVRTLVWNVPSSLLARHGGRFRHWTTPNKNCTRASNIASIVSFCFTGTSKGFL